ncbi:MAG: hypothetical protein HQK87_07525 [Nitrospinae bacterium]|nr:hypothetical protein [Nitrospinota bacterium]
MKKLLFSALMTALLSVVLLSCSGGGGESGGSSVQVGTTWRAVNVDSSTVMYGKVVWTGSQFFAAMNSGHAYSLDGETWTFAPTVYSIPVFGDQAQIVNDDSKLLVIGGSNNRGRFEYSYDEGITLSQKNFPSSIKWIMAIAYNGQKFAGFGFDISKSIMVSSADGFSWTSKSAGSAYTYVNINDMCWNGSKFVGVGRYYIQRRGGGNVSEYSSIVTSSDGDNWNLNTSSRFNKLYSVSCSGQKLVAVGDLNAVVTSVDGETWVAQTAGIPVAEPGTKYALNDVIWAENQYVAVGNLGLILTSPDGENWTQQDTGRNDDLLSVAYGAGKLVIFGRSKEILVSP